MLGAGHSLPETTHEAELVESAAQSDAAYSYHRRLATHGKAPYADPYCPLYGLTAPR